MDDFYAAKENNMKELGFDQSKEATMVFPNLSKNVLKMRIGMRRKQFLAIAKRGGLVSFLAKIISMRIKMVWITKSRFY